MMVGRLMLLSVAVHGIHHGSRIPLSSAKRVFDPDGFEKHPWGRVAFSCLVNSVKIVDLDKDSYTVQGCVHALLIWLYESVPDIGELYGLRRSSSTGIPLLDWQSTRKGIKIDEFIKNEMAKHGQVRVKHMVHVSEENMYPEWSDDVEKDPAVDNLITDLVHNSLLEDVWKVVKTVPMGKNKRKAKVNENGESRRSNKKLKMKDGFSIDEEGEKDVTKKESKGKEHMEDVEDERKSLLDIWRMIEKMNESISDLDKNLISRMDALEGKFEAFVEKRMGVLDEKLSDRIRMVEVDLKGMKETKPTNLPVDSTSNNNEEDEAHRPSSSGITHRNCLKNQSHAIGNI
ncbi:PREDICTED: uncharacterized protein LOC104718997 [Camelina sativa]|uniref:Uncharacterized protein LOC104718997 n=1 Tax=Camelina sativa TaxID=90675 RepID=A0ABM0U371_CAMSA|nr:PREDICTED: uncharacterized protein LOC104718997 [Camelina sativa]